MRLFFRKLLTLLPGEEDRVFLFTFLGFLWSLCATLGMRYTDGLFLSQIGADRLPIANILLSMGMIFFSAILLINSHKIEGKNIFLTVVAIAAVFYFFMALFLENKWLFAHPALLFGGKVISSLIYYNLITAYWTYLDYHHHHQDAHRLFGLFSTSVFSGVLAAGWMMNLFGKYGSAIYLILTIAFILVACLIFRISGQIALIGSKEEIEEFDVEISDFVPTIMTKIKMTLNSPYTLLIIALNFLFYFLWVISEYSYMSLIEKSCSKNNLHIIETIGKYFTIISIPNIIFGLFIYHRLLKRFGLGFLVMLTPMIYFCAFFGINLSGHIVFPLLMFTIIEGPFDIMENSNFSLLIKKLPLKTKFFTRVFIESFVGPIGIMTSGFLLTISGYNAAFLGFIIASGTVIIGLMLRPKLLTQSAVINQVH